MVLTAHRAACAGMARLAGVVGLLIAALTAAPEVPTYAAGVVSHTYTLVVVNSSITPHTLTVQENDTSPLITVRVAGSTNIVRRFGGTSDISDLSSGDHLLITGTNLGNRTVAATQIKDTSIQVAGTQINASVSWIARDFSRMAVHITANEGARAAFLVGSTILVDISAGTPVIFLGGQGGGLNTVQGLRPGIPITLYGFSDREGQVIISPHFIEEILSVQANALIRVAPNDSAAK